MKHYELKYVNKALYHREGLAMWLWWKAWDLWTTFTFDPNKGLLGDKRNKAVTPVEAKAYIARLIADHLPKDATFIWVEKWNEYGDCAHFHALIGNIGSIKAYELQDIWRKQYGFTKIEKYDPAKGRGACLYLAKHIYPLPSDEGASDWDCSVLMKEQCPIVSGNQKRGIVSMAMSNCKPSSVNVEGGLPMENKKISPCKAIRAKCLECAGGHPSEVRRCNSMNCPLFLYRFGHNPNRRGIGGRKGNSARISPAQVSLLRGTMRRDTYVVGAGL